MTNGTEALAGNHIKNAIPTSIPDELKALPQWVMWKLEEREGKLTKVPYNARYPTRRAASDDSNTWSSFNQAVFTIQNEPGLKLSGIGFMFAPPYIGVDLDHCRNPESREIDPEALEEITLLSSYTELSPSGTGVHVIVKGTIPEDGRKKGNREVYTRRRFFTITGEHLEGTPTTIKESQAAIDTLWKKWFPEPTPKAPQQVKENFPEPEDDEILSRCLKTSKSKFKALFEGDTSGYSSPSEADLALCTIIAMHTRDVSQIDRLFRQSGLYREKWDREDYARRTIEKALQATISTGEDVKKAPSKVDFSTIAEEIRKEMHTISVRQNLFYRDNGVYLTNTGQIEAKIQTMLTKIGYDKSLVSAKREVLSYLVDYEPYSVPPFNQHYGYIPVQNGVLHISKNGINLLPYADEYLFSYRLPVTYDPDADPEPVRDIFSDWVDEDNVTYLIQLPAQAIVQSWGDCFKTAYLFEGPKNAAKTTYLEFLGATIGSMNYSTTPLSDLLYNKYAKYDLLGKILNLSDDLTEIPLNNLGEFKKLTGGMPITVERKHCDRITMPLPAVHAFTCNRPPKCSITDDPAWWDRWVYVYFGNTFPINPQWKKGFITSENLSGYLRLIIDAIKEIMAGKFQRMDPTLVEMMWTSASDTVSKFLNADCTIEPTGEVSKDDFFEAYSACCITEKQTPIARNALTRELAKKGIIATRLNVRGKRVQAYRGVVLKNVRKNPDHHDQTVLTDNLGQGGQGFFNLRQMKENNQEDSTCTRTHVCNSENTLTTLTKQKPDDPQNVLVVRMLDDIEFMGTDTKEYICKRGDLITVPMENGRVLIERELAVLVHPESKRE